MARENRGRTLQPIHDWIFEHISDAVLFINKEGRIVASNNPAHSLLNITTSKSLITEYLNLESIVPNNGKEIMVRTKVKPEKLILLRSMQIGDHVCMILKEGGLQANKEAIFYSLNNILNGPYEGVVMHDGAQIIDCDQAFASLSGYNREELLGTNILDLIASQDHEKMIRSIESTANKPYSVKGVKKTEV
ncbi:PAS domain-containing protein [Piscibacillus salipiscarius]|uniref:PAS domain-containing protein n=1 Tax=Piscibacillus salipiscarius TaxID=299480 RepID=UPI0006D0653D|nr:PAS domain-containing protein [Piscibacillus salipiscarius]